MTRYSLVFLPSDNPSGNCWNSVACQDCHLRSDVLTTSRHLFGMRNWPGICWCFPPLTTLPATAEPQWHVKIVTYGLMFWPLSGALFGMWNWPDIRWCFSPLTILPVTAEPQCHAKIITHRLMFWPLQALYLTHGLAGYFLGDSQEIPVQASSLWTLVSSVNIRTLPIENTSKLIGLRRIHIGCLLYLTFSDY